MKNLRVLLSSRIKIKKIHQDTLILMTLMEVYLKMLFSIYLFKPLRFKCSVELI